MAISENIFDWLAARGLSWSENVVVSFESFDKLIERQKIHDGRDMYFCNGVFLGQCGAGLSELSFFVIQEKSGYKLITQQSMYYDDDEHEYTHVIVMRDLTGKEVRLLTEAYDR